MSTAARLTRHTAVAGTGILSCKTTSHAMSARRAESTNIDRGDGVSRSSTATCNPAAGRTVAIGAPLRRGRWPNSVATEHVRPNATGRSHARCQEWRFGAPCSLRRAGRFMSPAPGTQMPVTRMRERSAPRFQQRRTKRIRRIPRVLSTRDWPRVDGLVSSMSCGILSACDPGAMSWRTSASGGQDGVTRAVRYAILRWSPMAGATSRAPGPLPASALANSAGPAVGRRSLPSSCGAHPEREPSPPEIVRPQRSENPATAC